MTLARPPGRAMLVAVAALGVAGAVQQAAAAMSLLAQASSWAVLAAAVVSAVMFLWFVLSAVHAFVNWGGASQVGETDVALSRTADPLPYHCHVIDTIEGARKLTLDVTSQVFPNTNIPLDVVEQAQAINNRRLIGLVETESKRTMGWATVWPVIAETGKAIEEGRKPDDELVVTDLLRAEENRHAEYVVVLAVGLLKTHRNLPGGILPRLLARKLLWHIHDEFFDENDLKKLKILAIGDSPEGRRMCERIGLRPNGRHVRYAKVPEPKPVYCGEFSRNALLSEIRHFER